MTSMSASQCFAHTMEPSQRERIRKYMHARGLLSSSRVIELLDLPRLKVSSISKARERLRDVYATTSQPHASAFEWVFSHKERSITPLFPASRLTLQVSSRDVAYIRDSMCRPANIDKDRSVEDSMCFDNHQGSTTLVPHEMLSKDTNISISPANEPRHEMSPFLEKYSHSGEDALEIKNALESVIMPSRHDDALGITPSYRQPGDILNVTSNADEQNTTLDGSPDHESLDVTSNEDPRNETLDVTSNVHEQYSTLDVSSHFQRNKTLDVTPNGHEQNAMLNVPSQYERDDTLNVTSNELERDDTLDVTSNEHEENATLEFPSDHKRNETLDVASNKHEQNPMISPEHERVDTLEGTSNEHEQNDTLDVTSKDNQQNSTLDALSYKHQDSPLLTCLSTSSASRDITSIRSSSSRNPTMQSNSSPLQHKQPQHVIPRQMSSLDFFLMLRSRKH